MQKESKTPLVILIADDDEEDRMLTEDALEESQFPKIVKFVENGEEALDYLNNRGKFGNKENYQKPNLILLDLNMPKKDGRDVLAELKADPKLRSIPVVALTTSNSEEDIKKMYKLGVNSYITKPVTFQELVDAMTSLKNYWYDIVSLPKLDK